jgi:hypothetical protein
MITSVTNATTSILSPKISTKTLRIKTGPRLSQDEKRHIQKPMMML